MALGGVPGLCPGMEEFLHPADGGVGQAEACPCGCEHKAGGAVLWQGPRGLVSLRQLRGPYCRAPPVSSDQAWGPRDGGALPAPPRLESVCQGTPLATGRAALALRLWQEAACLAGPPPTPTQAHTGRALLASSCPAIPLGGRQDQQMPHTPSQSPDFFNCKCYFLSREKCIYFK